MKKTVRITGIVLALMMLMTCFGAVCVLAVADENGQFVKNGTFENGDEGWNLIEGYTMVSEDAALSGTKGLDIKTRSNYATAYQIITGLEPGKNYKLSFCAKTVSESVSAEGKVIGKDAGFRMTLRANGITGSPAVLYKYYTDNTDWTIYSSEFTTPEDTTDETTPFYLAFYNHLMTDGEWYVDEVSIKEIDAVNLWTNGDIEENSSTGITGWSVMDGRGAFNTNYFVDKTVKYEGTSSLKISSHDGSDPNYAETTTDLRFGTKLNNLTIGKTYKVSYKVMANNTSVRTWIRQPNTDNFQCERNLPTANEWYEMTYYFKAADVAYGTSGRWNMLIGIYGTNHGTIWYDDFQLTEVKDGDVTLGYSMNSEQDTLSVIMQSKASESRKAVNGKIVYASAGVKADSENAVLVLGVYSNSNGVKTLQNVVTSSTIQTAEPRLLAKIQIPETGNNEVQAFIWDGLVNIKNLGKRAVMKAE